MKDWSPLRGRKSIIICKSYIFDVALFCYGSPHLKGRVCRSRVQLLIVPESIKCKNFVATTSEPRRVNSKTEEIKQLTRLEIGKFCFYIKTYDVKRTDVSRL